jgi:hypothetical protein
VLVAGGRCQRGGPFVGALAVGALVIDALVIDAPVIDAPMLPRLARMASSITRLS